MSYVLGFLVALSATPLLAHAQALSAQKFIAGFLGFVNTVLIPFALGIAFLLVVINAIRFFVIHGADDDGRDAAKNLALYGVLAFVVIVIFWGVVNLLVNSLGFVTGENSPTPDYLEKNGAKLKADPAVKSPTTP